MKVTNYSWGWVYPDVSMSDVRFSNGNATVPNLGSGIYISTEKIQKAEVFDFGGASRQENSFKYATPLDVISLLLGGLD